MNSTSKIPTVAIIGRTNVGKSTLFNHLVGRRIAIVKDIPGVTRDRNYALVKRFARPFNLIDTGGLVGEEEAGIAESVVAQTESAIREADLVIAVFDGMHGPHPHDEEVVHRLRTARKQVIWVVNKCEKESVALGAAEFYGLGVDDLVFVSAAHNIGTRELLDRIKTTLNLDEPAGEDEFPVTQSIKVAIIGKPNAGKSTLINRLTGEDRLVTSDIAGTTRDSIDTHVFRDGREFTLIDTAGLRKKNRIPAHSIERFSNLRALRSLIACDVAVLVLDATLGPPGEQDAKIASVAHERGKSLVIVINKWDAIEKDHRTAKAYKDSVYEVLKFARYAPLVCVSALTGKRCPSILKKVAEVYDNSRLRIQTSKLNQLLTRAVEKYPPPVYRGDPVRLFFATQIGVAPPTIVLFFNHPSKINFSYERYLRNFLRKEYPFEGCDIKFVLKKRTEHEEAKSAANS